MSPNARSKALLETEGYLAYIAQMRVTRLVTRDLFGILDLVAIREGETLGVQATSSSNHAARRRKVRESEALPALLRANWRIEIHSWKKSAGRWKCRRELIEKPAHLDGRRVESAAPNVVGSSTDSAVVLVQGEGAALRAGRHGG